MNFLYWRLVCGSRLLARLLRVWAARADERDLVEHLCLVDPVRRGDIYLILIEAIVAKQLEERVLLLSLMLPLKTLLLTKSAFLSSLRNLLRRR